MLRQRAFLGEDEAAAMMQGKNAFRFKLEAFILGAALMAVRREP